MSDSLRGGCWSGAGCCGVFWLTASLCMHRCWLKHFWRQASRSWTSKCTNALCETARSRLICTAGGCRAPSSSQLRLCLYDHRPVGRKHQHAITSVLGPCSNSPAEGLLFWRREQLCASPGYCVILGFFTRVLSQLSRRLSIVKQPKPSREHDTTQANRLTQSLARALSFFLSLSLAHTHNASWPEAETRIILATARRARIQNDSGGGDAGNNLQPSARHSPLGNSGGFGGEKTKTTSRSICSTFGCLK